jgi:membrane protease YdiL (CAAX protease family)
MRRLSLAGFPFGGLLLAAAWWFVLFSPWTASPRGFWWGMVFATGTLLGYSAWLLRGQWRPLFHPRWQWFVLGIVSAALLYGLFWVGHHLVLSLFPKASEEIAAVYAMRQHAPLWLLALLLLFWIGPAEEIFWRGVVQRYFQQKLPPFAALLVTTSLYALIHAWAGNLSLLLAAFVVGLVWGLLFLRTGSLLPGILSHAVWDVLMVVVLPVQ